MKYRVLCHILVFLLCVGGLLAQTAVQDSLKLQNSTNASVVTQQEQSSTNTISVEIGGNALVWLSAHYEYKFAENFAFKIGLGLLPLSLAASINGSIGNGDHRFEYGLGLTFALYPVMGIHPPLIGGAISKSLFSASPFHPTARLGYRYQPVNGGFNFGIAFIPIFYQETIQPYGGISLGWGF